MTLGPAFAKPVAIGRGPYTSRHDYVVSRDGLLCRCGAPVKNLAHSASLQSQDKIAPSKSGIKHLEPDPKVSGVIDSGVIYRLRKDGEHLIRHVDQGAS